MSDDMMEILTREEVAKKMKVGVGKVDELTHALVLPHFKVGSSSRYRLKDIHRFIDRVTVGIK